MSNFYLPIKAVWFLVQEAFIHVGFYRPRVLNREYDIFGPDDQVIAKDSCELVVQPGWEIPMHMWPWPEGSLDIPNPSDLDFLCLPTLVDPLRQMSCQNIGQPMRKKVRLPPLYSLSSAFGKEDLNSPHVCHHRRRYYFMLTINRKESQGEERK